MKGSLLGFGGRVVTGFQRSQGFLLAGAVAYYTLLAIVPLFVVLLVGLSHVVDAVDQMPEQRERRHTAETGLRCLTPIR